MKTPAFDGDHVDRSTFAPFVLHDCRDTEWKDLRLTFDDWDGVRRLASGDDIDGYYLNGYGVEGLVKGAMLSAGIDVDAEGIHFNSEGDTCNIHFTDFEVSSKAASAAAAIMASAEALRAAVVRAREHGFED